MCWYKREKLRDNTLDGVAREGLSEKMTFELRHENKMTNMTKMINAGICWLPTKCQAV